MQPFAHVPHGLACAACLPLALAFNREHRTADYALLSDAIHAPIEAAVAQLWTDLKLQNPFPAYPLTDTDAIIAETLASGSTAATPRPVSPDDVLDLLTQLFSSGC